MRSQLPNLTQRWRDIEGTTGEIFVIAHRGAFIRDNHAILPENSILALERAKQLGCDMVELDVRFTIDGTAVVMHDDTLDRTTTGHGYVANYRYRDLKELQLIHPITKEALDSKIPTLEAFFEALGNKVMVNAECKTGVDAISKVAEIAHNAGVAKQIVIKTNHKSATDFNRVADVLAKSPYSIDFSPVLVDDRDSLEQFEQACQIFNPSLVECVVRCPKSPGGTSCFEHLGLTQDGGPWFSIPARRLAKKYNTRLYIGTLYVDPLVNSESQWNGGRNCQLARVMPDSVYSFWIAHGATVIQTDEPEFLINWLKQSGFRNN